MFDDTEKQSLRDFIRKVKDIIRLLEEGNEEEARSLFNKDVYEPYRNLFSNFKTLPHSSAFFISLDEYFNRSTFRSVGGVTKDIVLTDYHDSLDEMVSLPLRIFRGVSCGKF